MPVLHEGAVILNEDGACLVDLGRGVAGLLFRSAGGCAGPGIAEAVRRSVREVERDWRGLVLASEGPDFSAGWNFRLLLAEAENGDWDGIDLLVREMQEAALSLRRMTKPSVAALHGRVWGPGAAWSLAADRMILDRETRFGFPEAKLGLIPAAGGCLAAAELAALRAEPAGLPEPSLPLVALYDAMAFGRTSENGGEVRRLGWTRPGDFLTAAKPHDRIQEAVRSVLELERDRERGTRCGEGREEGGSAYAAAAGRDASAALKLRAAACRRAGRFSDHDAKAAGKLAEVLAGGDVRAGTPAGEAHWLELEREAFLSLLGEPLTQERIRYWLTDGAYLRN
ncbi:enoyl-CoA hydratase/isomerase family protein [Cohnella caldifontis]|uniref:enoyl-CoA hydratase/isomerase family protein n=1 Tax=Cohnella caldifontis TaxID=3027471 RepID=UPI0023EBBE82|nr:enoyl-CoA hydratase/isomerase family protein [Cohnella sp. YIM B05605]